MIVICGTIVEPESSVNKDGKGGWLSREGADSPSSPGMVAASFGSGETADTGTHQWHQDLHHDQDTRFLLLL